MQLRSLSLLHFRSHRSLQLDFAPDVTIIIGPNGSGKSSILEAIHLFSLGKSIRALQTSEMISIGAELARVQVVGEVVRGDGKADWLTENSRGMDESGEQGKREVGEKLAKGEKGERGEQEQISLEVMITRGIVGGRRTVGKLWSVNQVRRAQRAAVGTLKSVLFRPEDMRLIEGSPARRREYLNAPLAQLYREYAVALDAYDKHLVRRNKLLLAVREREQPRTVLTYWSEGVLKHGQVIQRFRQQFFAALPLLQVELPFTALYQPSIISADRQRQYLEKEIVAGHTLIGPHKDDFDVILPPEWLPASGGRSAEERRITATPNGVQNQDFSVMLYGSRGQQRLAVLWLKLCEAAYLHSISGEKPLLLLDDILSELDQESRERVRLAAEAYQTILTTIDPVEVKKLFSDTSILRLPRPRQ